MAHAETTVRQPDMFQMPKPLNSTAIRQKETAVRQPFVFHGILA